MNDEVLLRQHLQTNLSRLDWSTGITKEMVLERLGGEPATQRTIARALADGVYFSPADVLAALPTGAWSELPSPPPIPPASEAPRPILVEDGMPGGGELTSPPDREATGPSGNGQWQDGSSDQRPQRTAMLLTIGAGVIALAGVVAWLGRRLLRK